jgi:PBSX family phage terminase large subunit
MQCLNCHTAELVTPVDSHPSYLVCPNCNGMELLYEPQDYQSPIHEIEYLEIFNNETGRWEIAPQIIASFGGYGSGKSKSSLQEFFLRCLENPKGTGLVTAPTLQLLKRTTIKTLLNEIIPPLLVKNYNKSDGEIHLQNGFVIYTIPSDDDEKLRSINAGLIHLEEASGINRTIYDQLLTRMRDPFVKNKALFVCSNPELGWIKDVLVDNDKRKSPTHPEHEDYNPYVTVFIWETKLNKFLPPNFIEINSKGKPDWWKRKYLEGSFEAAEGAVYPNFAKCMIEPLPISDKTDKYGIPKTWERIIGFDHGLRNPTAIVFAAINPEEGEVIVYNEYYKPNTLVPEHAKNLKKLLEEIPYGLLRFIKADPSVRNKTDPVNGKSVQGLYQEYGIYLSEGNNNIETGLLRVNSYIERGKYKIFNTCINTIREHLRYTFPEISMDDDKNLDEKPVKKDDHSCDANRYMMMALPDDPKLLKLVAFEPKMTYNTPIKVENEYGWDDDYANQYNGSFLNYV